MTGRRSNRLRRRIVGSTALIAALAMAAIIGTVLLGLAALTRSTVRGTLDDRFDVLSGSIASSSDGGLTALETPDDAVDDTTWLYGSDGVEVDGPRAGDRVQAVADSLGEVERRTRVTRHERVYLAGPVERGSGRRGVLIVSESLEPYEATRTELVVGLVLVGLVVTAGATAIAAWTVTRTLRPVDAMADLADDWSTLQLDARFDDRTGDGEIAHLGRTLNVLLDRVAAALRGEQRLTSELAHELRTPLTAIRAECELATLTSPAPAPAARERLERVIALTDRMSTTITTLLDIARGSSSAEKRTTVAAVLEAVLAGRSGPRVPLVAEVSPADGARHIAGTAEVVARALSPLVDNAEAYAGSRVLLTCSVGERVVVLSVSDDGPGVPARVRETLFTPGARADRDSAGAGLGLALSRRAARSLGGEVSLASAGAPTTFSITLPRA